jgi:Short C-terminal domain
MGLFSKLSRGGGGVHGTAQVTSCSGYQGRGIYSMCRMQLIVQAEGVAPTAVEFEGLVHRNRWPQPGMTLPVSLDPADPHSAKIEWDEVPDARDRSRANAEAMAAAMRGEGGGGLGGAQVINLSGGQLSEEQRAKLRMLGIDPGGAPAAAPEPDDQLAKLERLGALRAQGVLTEEEFQEQKRRLLG